METSPIRRHTFGIQSFPRQNPPQSTEKFDGLLATKLSGLEGGIKSESYEEPRKAEDGTKDFCDTLKETGIFLFENWIRPDQVAAIREQLSAFQPGSPITAKDVGLLIEKHGIDCIYLPKISLKSDAMLDGILEDSDWVPIEESVLKELIQPDS